MIAKPDINQMHVIHPEGPIDVSEVIAKPTMEDLYTIVETDMIQRTVVMFENHPTEMFLDEEGKLHGKNKKLNLVATEYLHSIPGYAVSDHVVGIAVMFTWPVWLDPVTMEEL